MPHSLVTNLRAIVMALLALSAPWCRADELRVFAAGAAKQAMEAIAPVFQRASGHTIRPVYDTVGALRDRVLGAPPGAVADVVILSDAALESLRASGRLATGPGLGIGRVVVALAVPDNAPAPDLSTPDALRQALLAAPSIAYADPARGATAGTHFAKVIDAMGLRAALQAKTTLMPFGVDVILAVSEGRYALGVSQSSEIMQHKGIRFAGALPAPHGLATGYGAAPTSDRAIAAQLLEFLATPEAMREFRRSGVVAAP